MVPLCMVVVATFHARPGEQGPVECLELADGVGDGEGGFAGIVFTRWRPDLPATA